MVAGTTTHVAAPGPVREAIAKELVMKMIVMAAMALSLLGGGAASAQDWRSGNRDRADRHERNDDRGNRGDRGDRGKRGDRGDRDWRNDRDGGRYSEGRRYDNRSYERRSRWERGQRLPPSYWSQGVDYRNSHLRRPPQGYRWVRVGNDYVLTAVATGLILEVISGGGY